MKKQILILIFSLATLTSSYSQSWDLFTADNSGLPNNYINNLTLDSNDNIWYFTKNSIFMYNQNENKWNEFNEENSNLISGFTHIEIGKEGSVYVSSSNIYKFDSELMNFNIIEENINCDKFTFDKNGILYFVKQVNVYSKVDDKITLIYNGQIEGPNYPTELVLDENDILWFAIDGYSSALYSYDGSTLDTLDSIFKENPRISINTISMDRKSNFWLGHGADGILLKYNKESGNWKSFNENNSPLDYDGVFLKDLKTNNKNDVWLISAIYNSLPPISLFKYNGLEWSEFRIDEVFDFSGNEIFSLLSLAVDIKNNVWIGTNKGLIKFNETTTNVENSTENDISLYPNPVNDILTIDLEGKHATSYSITDVYGRELIVENTPLSGSNNIDIRTLISGTYFISIELSDSKTITSKFVKE